MTHGPVNVIVLGVPAVVVLWSLVWGLLPFLPVWYPEEFGGRAVAPEVFAVQGLVALGVAAVRRAWFAPAHLHRSFDDDLIIALIGVWMVSTLLGQGFRRAAVAPAPTAWRSTGGLLAPWFAVVPAPDVLDWANATWWAHMVTGFACPEDVAMFRDALKTTGQEGKLAVKDLAELVGEAISLS